MAVAQISKIKIIANSKHQNAILEKIQDLGLMQIEKNNNNEEEISQQNQELSLTQYQTAGVKFSLSFLKKYSPPSKENFIQKIKSRKFHLTNRQITEKTNKSDYLNIIEQTQKLESELNQAINKISGLSTDKNILEQWQNLKEIPQNNLEYVELFLGEIKPEQFTELFNRIAKEHSLSQIDKVNESLSKIQFSLIYDKKNKKDIQKIIHNFDCKEAEIPATSKNITQTIKDLNVQVKTCQKQIINIKKELRKLSQKTYDLKIVHDYLEWKKEREKIKQNLTDTKYTFTVNGWMATDKIPQLKQELSTITKEFEVESRPPKKEENVPVLLQNNETITPFEFITNLYGSPKYDEPDPSPFLAPFFILFFALCLTDAGYGFILSFLILAIIYFFKIPKQNRKMLMTLFWGGLITIVMGTLFGGWFGIQLRDFAPSPIRNLLLSLQIIDPMKDSLKVLFISLGLGFIQVVFGLLLGMFWQIKQGKTKEGIYDYGLWAGLLISLILWALAKAGIILAGITSLLLGILLFFVAGLVLTQGRNQKNIIGKVAFGILSLYGLVGYGSDILSYSRLLALGLATGVVAMVVNIMGGLVNDLIPFVGWIFAIFIIIGGHIFNMAINILGAYIHSMRLQFVEFFPKFMEGGGDIFSPFKKTSKYVKLQNSDIKDN